MTYTIYILNYCGEHEQNDRGQKCLVSFRSFFRPCLAKELDFQFEAKMIDEFSLPRICFQNIFAQ